MLPLRISASSQDTAFLLANASGAKKSNNCFSHSSYNQDKSMCCVDVLQLSLDPYTLTPRSTGTPVFLLFTHYFLFMLPFLLVFKIFSPHSNVCDNKEDQECPGLFLCCSTVTHQNRAATAAAADTPALPRMRLPSHGSLCTALDLSAHSAWPFHVCVHISTY